MRSSRPNDVVDQIVNWDFRARTRRLCSQIVEAAKVDVVLTLLAKNGKSLTNISVAKIVQQVRPQNGRVTGNQAFRAVEVSAIRRLAGELRSARAGNRSGIRARRAAIAHQPAT